MGDPRRTTASAPRRRGIPPLRRPLRRREGGGSPSRACTYGRLGWRPRRRRRGGRGAGGGVFGVVAIFSGGGALRGRPSSRATGSGSRPGVVLEPVFSRQIWDGGSGGRRGGSRTAPLLARGKVVEDLGRGPRIWSRVSSGASPGRCFLGVPKPGSSEAATDAALQRLMARGSAVPRVVDLRGGVLRRLRRRRARLVVDL